MAVYTKKSEQAAAAADADNVNEVAETSVSKAPFVLKTEFGKNLLVKKLNETIHELQIELVNQNPRYVDLDLYIEALKEDIISIKSVKSNYIFKK